MKKPSIRLIFGLFLVVTSCKKEINPNAYLQDPLVQYYSELVTSAESELKSANENYLAAKKQWGEAKLSNEDGQLVRYKYYTMKEKLATANKNLAWSKSLLKYRKLEAQEQYLRYISTEQENPTGWIDKDTADRVKTAFQSRRVSK